MSKMSDQERFEELMSDFGLTPEKTENDDKSVSFQFETEAQKDKKVIGYHGFVADFTFDQDGKFANLGVWE